MTRDGHQSSAAEREPKGEAILARLRAPLDNRLVRFFLVGALNTAFAYALFAVLFIAGIAYPLASALATVIGILFSFGTIGRLVFGSHDLSLIGRFLGVYGIVWFVGVTLLRWGERHGVAVLLAAAFLAAPMGLFSYFLQRVFVFRGRR